MKFTRRLIACVVSAAISASSLPAHAGAVIGATEPTQILNMIQLMMSYVEQAQQTVTQIQQYQSMLRNLQNMTPSALLNSAAMKLWQDANMTQTFTGLRNIVVSGQKLDYSLSHLDASFKQQHPGYSGYGKGFNFGQAYSNWSDETNGAVRNSLALAAAHEDDFATEESMMNELNAKSQSASGQLESLQAGQQISMAMVGQLQKLRELQVAQMRTQDAFVAAEQGKTDAPKASLDRIMGQLPANSRIKSSSQ